ncbi:hypothetical protein AmDm5_2916 [Acetobacter malorum]|nr:hypothetical protein AmDm5_2916 [Acetobacter malorum]
MRYTALEKLEIIRLVEQSALSVRQVRGKIGIRAEGLSSLPQTRDR